MVSWTCSIIIFLYKRTTDWECALPCVEYGKGACKSSIHNSILLEEFHLDLFSGHWPVLFNHRAYNRPWRWPRDSPAAPEAELNLVVSLVAVDRFGGSSDCCNEGKLIKELFCLFQMKWIKTEFNWISSQVNQRLRTLTWTAKKWRIKLRRETFRKHKTRF